jgi:hypothetical protein
MLKLSSSNKGERTRTAFSLRGTQIRDPWGKFAGGHYDPNFGEMYRLLEGGEEQVRRQAGYDIISQLMD